MIRKNTIFNNLKWVDEGKNEKERIERMKIVSCKEIKSIFEYTFNDKIVWALPKEIEYIPSKDEESSLYLNLFKEIKKLDIFFTVGKYAKVTLFKKHQIFVEILQNIHPDDALLLLSMKDKKLPFKNITTTFLKKVWAPNGTNFTSRI